MKIQFIFKTPLMEHPLHDNGSKPWIFRRHHYGSHLVFIINLNRSSRKARGVIIFFKKISLIGHQ